MHKLPQVSFPGKFLGWWKTPVFTRGGKILSPDTLIYCARSFSSDVLFPDTSSFEPFVVIHWLLTKRCYIRLRGVIWLNNDIFEAMRGRTMQWQYRFVDHCLHWGQLRQQAKILHTCRNVSTNIFPQYFPNPRSQTSSLFCQQLRRGGLAQGWPMREEDKKYRPMGSQL